MEGRFTFGTALKIIFEYIQAPPAVLAEQYVDRDRTLVYKWLRGTAFPPKKLFPDIIRFVMECSGDSVRDLIRMEMARCLTEMELDAQYRKMLEEKPDFADYLESVFSLLAAEKTRERSPKQIEETTLFEAQTYLEPPPPPKETEIPQTVPISAPAKQEIHIRLSFAAAKNIGFALLASLSGELLWIVIAYTFKWPHVVSGFPAFFRGILVFPAVLFAVLSLMGETLPVQTLPKAKISAYMCCYAFAGGLGALLLAGANLEYMVKNILPGYVSQSLLLVFIQALVFSFFPLLTLLALLRFPRVLPGAFLILEFGPALVYTLVSLPILLSGRAPAGQLLSGGFFPNCTLMLLMFLSARTVFKDYPNTIKIAFTKIPQV